MASQAVSLDDVRILKVALGWHEAVALVQEVAAVTMARGRMPDPDLVILTPLGELSVKGDLDSAEPPVQALAELLQSLLMGAGVPSNLKALATGALSGESEHATVEAFSKALAFFERPNRRADIAAVCTRTAAAALQVRSDIELEQIRARRSRGESKAKAAKKPTTRWTWTWPSALPIKTVMATAAVIVALGVGAVALTRLLDQPPTVEADTSLGAEASTDAQATAFANARLSLTQFVQAGLAAVGVVTSLSAPEAEAKSSAAPVEVAPPPRRAAAFSSTSSNAVDAPKPVDLTVRLDANEPVTTPPADVRIEERPAGLAEVVPLDDTGAEYTAGDREVEPATLIRPQIPSFVPAEATTEEVGVLELSIDETGAVKQVRLVSPTNRFQERMLVSAAKAWRFNPAVRDGRPVPYRLRVRITI